MPFNHLILCHPLLLLPSIFPSIRVFSNELALHQMAKVLELQFQHQSFQWIFRVDFLKEILKDGLVWSPHCPRDSQESSLAPQFESISSSVLSFVFLSYHFFFGPFGLFISLSLCSLINKRTLFCPSLCLQKGSLCFMPLPLWHDYWKTIALTVRTSVGKVMFLLLKMLILS